MSRDIFFTKERVKAITDYCSMVLVVFGVFLPCVLIVLTVLELNGLLFKEADLVIKTGWTGWSVICFCTAATAIIAIFLEERI
jgi:hypothetical protein